MKITTIVAAVAAAVTLTALPTQSYAEFWPHPLPRYVEQEILTGPTDAEYTPSWISFAEQRKSALLEISLANKEADAEMQYRAAVHYRKGKFVPRNWRKVGEYLISAVEQGHIYAKHDLALYLNNVKLLGLGLQIPNGQIAQNFDVNNPEHQILVDYTISLHKEAALYGIPDAIKVMADLYYESPLIRDDKLINAYAWYSLAMLHPDPEFIQTEEQRRDFVSIKTHAVERITDLNGKMSVEEIRTAQAMSTEIFQKILQNRNSGS